MSKKYIDLEKWDNLFYNNNQFYLKIYNDNYIRFYSMSSPPCKKREQKRVFSDSSESSLSRSKREIRELALCNDFKYFVTLTVNSQSADRFSLSAVQDRLRKCIRNLRLKLNRRGIEIKYLFITEKHKDGAFHFHGLISDISFDLYTNSNGYFSSSVFDFLGFNSFSIIHDYTKTCNYITKYITKDCIRNENNQIFIRSRGLKYADTQVLKDNIFNYITPAFKSDFIQISDFDLSKMKPHKILILQRFLEKFGID